MVLALQTSDGLASPSSSSFISRHVTAHDFRSSFPTTLFHLKVFWFLKRLLHPLSCLDLPPPISMPCCPLQNPPFPRCSKLALLHALPLFTRLVSSPNPTTTHVFSTCGHSTASTSPSPLHRPCSLPCGSPLWSRDLPYVVFIVKHQELPWHYTNSNNIWELSSLFWGVCWAVHLISIQQLLRCCKKKKTYEILLKTFKKHFVLASLQTTTG